ncbi:MAG: hypothetical protein HYZ42_07870 [Bacteroidetes bacterium]|nr:hypothetical protein [Bacteroidota bacterium]
MTIPKYDANGHEVINPTVYDGEAVHIYIDGKLFKTIKFSELNIDTSKIMINEYVNRFAWKYRIHNNTKDALKMKMLEHPDYIENDKLYLIAADNQLIAIEIATGQITRQPDAYEILKQRSKWNPTKFDRKFDKVIYPDKFLLPTLQNGKSIEQEYRSETVHLFKYIFTHYSSKKMANVNMFTHHQVLDKTLKKIIKTTLN